MVPASSWAFRVSPMISEFDPSGDGATRTFQIENTGDDKVSVQLEMFHRFIDINGKETRTATEEFSVYPQQITMGSHEKHSVRVTWQGNHTPERELAYRMEVTELMSDAKKKTPPESKTDPKFLLEYITSVYVKTKGFEPHIEVDSFRVLPDSSKLKGELILKNTGLAHRVLKGLHIFLKGSNGVRTELKSDEMTEIRGENILPLAKRRFVLTLPAPTPTEAAIEW
jgi:fimbrial chaperone protein